MSSFIRLKPDLYFSYSQFIIFDESEKLPGCNWTDEHSNQGFARRPSSACFGTLLEFGTATLRYSLQECASGLTYARVITVPFLCSSGTVVVEGPEETDVQRYISIPPSHYRLTAAQAVSEDKRLAVDLFFESLIDPLERSAIIVADPLLAPPNPLQEHAEIAGY